MPEDEVTEEQLRELAKKYAEGIISDWAFESLGEMAEEYEITFEQMKRVAKLAADAEVIV